MGCRSGISRREFVGCAAAGTAWMCLHGCAALAKRGGRANAGTRPPRGLTERDTFRGLADMALSASKADHTLVSLTDAEDAAARFGNGEIVRVTSSRRQELAITVAFAQQVGVASTANFSEDGIVAALRQAESVAKDAPPDPEYLPPLPPQRYPVLVTFRPETASAGPARCEAEASEAIRLCQRENLRADGYVGTRVSAVGVAASSGLFAYEQRTRAEFNLTATGADSSGWVGNANRSIDDLGVVERTRTAIDKAKRSASPPELPAGRYTAILEPAAVAGLVGPLLEATDARACRAGAGALRDKLGEPIIDQRLTLRNRPDHPSLLGRSFDGNGLPSDAQIWIEHGVLKRLNYDRFVADQHGVDPSYDPDAVHLVVAGTGASVGGTGASVGGTGVSPVSGRARARAATIGDLVSATERGVLVTSFTDVRCADPGDLTLSGATRGGTFLVEDGRVVTGLPDLPWQESPLRAFNRVAACSTPTDAFTGDGRKMFVPAMVIRDFDFSGLTRL